MFVGYSISSEAEDFVTDDDVNGERLVKFLVNWFEKFDAYKGREFYLMSESYGGHYL
jgi:serine carboxypeptidase-like clade II